jgi:isopropylmalate/homocitrate/citramalate synthase
MTASTSSAVELVEVGPRDGFQAIDPFIPTARKIDFVLRLVGAGLRRIEVGWCHRIRGRTARGWRRHTNFRLHP